MRYLKLFGAALICALIVGCVAAQQPASIPQVQVIEQHLFIPDPQAPPGGLEALEVRAAGDIPRPLVLMTHDSASSARARKEYSPYGSMAEALWFVQRGYVALIVVRRGYGQSGGDVDLHPKECSRGAKDYIKTAKSGADDLRVAAEFMSRYPEVDSSTIVSIGDGTGGFIQIALAANPPRGLKAAINVSGGMGGDGGGGNCNPDGVEAAFRHFGKNQQVPMLWLFADNDQWYQTDTVQRYQTAYAASIKGLQLTFLTLPMGRGHRLFSWPTVWSQVAASYLQTLRLLPLSNSFILPFQNSDAPPGLGAGGRRLFRSLFGVSRLQGFRDGWEQSCRMGRSGILPDAG